LAQFFAFLWFWIADNVTWDGILKYTIRRLSANVAAKVFGASGGSLSAFGKDAPETP
jgi:hypothetical protein